ncbi:MAG: type II secretory pathway pseudopilin PulG [Lysobacterales bacterium]|jgi:type II secretory pathway pseudopilin PulG
MSISRTRQTGVTLLELLIAMGISLVVSLAMITLMANTMSTGTQTMESTRLSSELRTAMQIMTRDIRRANFHGNFTGCFGNPDCRADDSLEPGGVVSHIKPITLADSVGTDDCILFWFDRDANKVITNDYVGAFRRALVGGIGVVQMTVNTTGAPNCTNAANWFSISNPALVDITELTFSNVLSFTDVISSAGSTQQVGKVQITLTGQLVKDIGLSVVEKTIQDTIRIRNDIFSL